MKSVGGKLNENENNSGDKLKLNKKRKNKIDLGLHWRS